MAALQTFRQYRISQDRSGGTVELWRSGTEVACLAVDSLRHQFVELHVVTGAAEKQMEARNFQQLIQLAVPLRHRNLLGVIEGGEDEGANFFITEFLDGERFDTWLARCNPLPPWLALQTIGQIVEGLCVLAPHPRLLAGVELLNCGISLNGENSGDLTARVCDIGLSSPPSRPPDPRQLEARLIQETGRLLLYMLTGAMPQGPAESLDLASLAIAPELGFLLGTIFMPSMQHHPRTLEQLRTLVERCARDLSPELAARPEKIPAAMRPRLPLLAHFMTGAGVADIAGDECTVDTRAFDAMDPYRHRATQRATRTPLMVQLLPPDRLMPPEYGKMIVQAGEQIRAQEHPHLLRVLAWDEKEHPEVLVEEYPGRWNLESMVRLRGRLEPAEVLLVLEQMEAAVKEAESIGLVPVLRSPWQVMVQFIAAGGEEALPPQSELSRTPLSAWPAFRLKVRTWPLTLNFTQPERFNPERLIYREPGAVEHHQASRGASFAQQPSARDYALLAIWMLGGSAHISERLRPLLHDHLSSRGEAAVGGRREFLERLTSRVDARPSGQTGPVPGTRRGSLRGETAAVALSIQPIILDDDVTAPAPGFAEALFGAGKTRTVPVENPLLMPQRSAVDDEASGNGYLDGLLPGLPGVHGDDEPEHDDAPAPNRLFIWLLVILVAALLAGVAAHLNGTAFWQR